MICSLRSIAIIFICICNLSYYKSSGMDKLNYIKALFSETSLKPLEPDMGISCCLAINQLTKQSLLYEIYETIKPIFLNLTLKCYNNPKLLLTTLIVSYLVYSLKKSVITRYDLQKFKKEGKQIAQQQRQEFIRSNDNTFANFQKNLEQDFSNSEIRLNALQNCIEKNQDNLAQIPEAVATSLTNIESSEKTLLLDILSAANRSCTTSLERLTQHDLTHDQTQKVFYAHHFGALLKQTDNTHEALNILVSQLMNALSNETESLYTLLHEQNNQEALQLTQFRSSMNTQYNSFNEQLDLLIKTLAEFAENNHQEETNKKSF